MPLIFLKIEHEYFHVLCIIIIIIIQLKNFKNI
jgi:hypothetical protein